MTSLELATQMTSPAQPHGRLAVLRAVAVLALGSLLVAGQAGGADAGKPIAIDDASFKCITEMKHVRHFYVDNLLGNVAATVAVAEKGSGDYPVGSVLQLVPNEVMIKQPKGFSPATRDWEFFFIDVSEQGSKIYKRGFAEVNNPNVRKLASCVLVTGACVLAPAAAVAQHVICDSRT
jgi:hypothetical protein